jgi:putative transposase
MLKNRRKGGDPTMNLTVKLKLLPTQYQIDLLNQITAEYIAAVNNLVSAMVEAQSFLKLTSKDVYTDLPSAVKNQAIQDAKSVYRKSRQIKLVPILKKPVCIWNNQNYRLHDDLIEFPVVVGGRSTRIKVKAIYTDYQRELLRNKLGTLRITQKSGKWIAQIAVTVPEKVVNTTHAMGVDLGLKVPAVAITDEGRTKFFGNGRQNKYMRRKYRTLRQQLGVAKKPVAIKRMHDKEQRWMKDQDHKISRGIVNFALANNVSVIRLEQLTNIRNTAKTSRKNEKSLHTWSFYRLAQFIEYKATLEGIKVEYVDPAYTSQSCPICGKLNTANDRLYTCSCGFKTHRDRLGALNIIKAPVIDGNSLSA